MTLENSQPETPEHGPHPRRVIKRYSNRKLYDTLESRYVTLLQIADLVRAGADVQIIDNATKEDKTDVTLALIISEELKARPRGMPLATLKALIRARGERLLSQLKGGTLRKLISRDDAAAETLAAGTDSREDAVHGAPTSHDGTADAVSGFRATLEQWQRAADEQIRAVLPSNLEHWQKSIDEQLKSMLPGFAPFRDLQMEVRELRERIAILERRLGVDDESTSKG